jgi:hypothetical protein
MANRLQVFFGPQRVCSRPVESEVANCVAGYVKRVRDGVQILQLRHTLRALCGPGGDAGSMLQ